MTESVESLTSEQERVLTEVEEIVLSAISARCACSNAKFRPHSIARAVAVGRISEDTANGIASRFSACQGLSKEGEVGMCHFPQHAPSET